MEDALVERLRASDGVKTQLGKFGNRPSVDAGERRSDEPATLPALVITKISPGKLYDQDGPGGLQRPRARVEVFGRTYGSMKDAARAVITELETRETIGGIRFHRGQLQFERDFPPEDLGGNIKIFRTVLDFFLPFTPE